MTILMKIVNTLRLLFTLKDDFKTIHSDIEKVFDKAKKIEAKEELKITQAATQVERLQNTADKAYDNLLEVKEVSGTKAMKAKVAAHAVEHVREALSD